MRVNTYQKIENLLYNYQDFKKVVEEKEKSGEVDNIPITVKYVGMIEKALDDIRTDEYYDIIPLIYYHRLTTEEVGEELEKNVSTIYRNKKRLIKKLEIKLMSDDVLLNILNA